jgi:hypothetical protein
VKEAVHIGTDLGEKLQAQLTAYATVVPGAAPPATAATTPATTTTAKVPPVAVPGDGTPAANGGTASTAAKPVDTTPASVARQE